ncbi:MAG: winged helix-turn-helix transcriptional regulator [Gammaproteobacteria bacterium]|nr:winged helix-turn-helix transcriptional regulator [Gammaproteobacteria bacterium]
MVLREVKPTSPPSVEYFLTELGRELMPAIAAVGKKFKKTGISEPVDK